MFTQRIKHCLVTITVLLCSLVVSAHDFEVDGIYYNITDEFYRTVEVTFKGNYYQDFNEYSGSITLPATVTYNGVTYSVTSIGYNAFQYCTSLTAITIPESVTDIKNAAFNGCSSLTDITIPEGSLLTNIGYNTFQNCSSLTCITIPKGVTDIKNSAFNGCSSLTDITIPEGSLLTNIGYYAFNGCSSLTGITIPESVTSIGEEAFVGCSSLTAIAIPKGVMSVGDHPFKYCSNLVSIIVEEGNVVYDSRNGCNAIIETSSNTLIQGCSETIIPESVTSIGDCAFEGCTNLTSIILPEILMSIGDWAFKSCDSLTSITIPESMMSIGDEAFANCSSLTSIIIPESLTSIGTYAFSGCDELSAVYISSLEAWCNIDFGGDYANPLYSAHDLYLNEQLVTEYVFPDAQTVIKDYTFDGCAKLTSVTLPEGITEIGYSTFSWCTGLTAINIPEGVTSIGNYAFCGCSGLTSITCNVATPPTIGGSNTFYGVDRSIPVYVPEGSVEAYKAAAFWSEFTNIHITYLSQSHSYLKNIGSGKFLTAANNWGAYASLGERGLDVTISELPNGKYTIETRIRNDETGGRYLGSNLYMDMKADDSEWIITELSNGYYTLSLDGEHYIGYDGKSSLITNTSTDPTDVNVQWRFLTKDDLIAEMANARYTAPVDATFFISGANFSRSDQRNALWQGGPVFGGYNREEGSNFCAEKWNVGVFDVYQELAVPNGCYQVTMQGFYRVGSSDNHAFEAVNRHENGTEMLNAIFYANEKEMPLMSIVEEAQSSPLAYGTWDNTSVGYLPNDMESAASAFSEELYEHSIWVHVTDGVLRIGVKKEVGEANDWAIFDNFRLNYYGPVATISDAQTSFSQADDKEYASITYTRNFKNTNWQALYVPFDIPVTEEFLEEFEVSYIYNTRQYDRDDDGVKDETIIEAFKMTSGSLEANYPYLIRAKVAGVKDIVVTNATLYATEENSIDCSSVFETYTFTGTYSRMSSVLLPQDEGYYALSGGEWRPVADGTSLGAFRFYMKIDSRNGGGNNVANARSIRMRFVGDDEDGETTGVESSTLNSQPSTLIYDLQGRRVDNPTKGVYIVNGKKVLVR